MFFRRKKVAGVDANDITEKNLNQVVDFTLLNPVTTTKELENFLSVAYKNRYYSVCVNPINVKYAKKYISNKLKDRLKLCSVVGFPLGENATEIKVAEARLAISDGADEVDVVAPISRIKNGDWRYVKDEISRIVRSAKGRVVKVVVETACLTKGEIEKICQICVRAKVDFIMTSTGFANGGATPEVVEIIKNVVKNKCGIKASGGISGVNDAMNLVRMGANRIGTSWKI